MDIHNVSTHTHSPFSSFLLLAAPSYCPCSLCDAQLRSALPHADRLVEESVSLFVILVTLLKMNSYNCSSRE